MYTSFLYLYMIKNYNFFSGIDKYFKELAKVFLELKSTGLKYPSENYQELLNRQFFLKNDQDSTYFENMDFEYKNVYFVY